LRRSYGVDHDHQFSLKEQVALPNSGEARKFYSKHDDLVELQLVVSPAMLDLQFS
jgi:hypothetical protein